ncbi:MAG: glycine cleavage system aminomethyltransferase GcvT [Myxococcota bacterium]
MSEKTTPLHDRHLAAGARMVPFAGYSMPVQYTGVVDEHRAVRERVGLFDVSHMGEVFFEGPEAAKVVNRIISNDLSNLEPGGACYTVMCREDGGIIDDLVAYYFSSERVMICVNAANRSKDFEWMVEQAAGDCKVRDASEDWAQIAVQGPKAAQLVERLCGSEATTLKSYRFMEGELTGREAIIARTGYTGEDGFELYVHSEVAGQVWDLLMERGVDLGVTPAGLGARDSLRLEMCFPLYGNDITEDENPYEAGLGWVVKLDKEGGFVGREALAAVKSEGPRRRLAPIVVSGRGIPRAGYAILSGDESVGRVTSGTMGPSVQQGIGLAYVPKGLAKAGTALNMDVRGRSVPVEVVKRPFLRRG